MIKNTDRKNKLKWLKTALMVPMLILAMVLLTACSGEDKTKDTFSALTLDQQLVEMSNFIGMTQKELNKAWQGGTEGKTDDGKTLIGVNYLLKADAKEYPVVCMFAESSNEKENKVELVQVDFVGEDLANVEQILTTALGQPKEASAKIDGEDGNDSQYAVWHYNGCEYRLQNSYGQTSLGITKLS